MPNRNPCGGKTRHDLEWLAPWVRERRKRLPAAQSQWLVLHRRRHRPTSPVRRARRANRLAKQAPARIAGHARSPPPTLSPRFRKPHEKACSCCPGPAGTDHKLQGVRAASPALAAARPSKDKGRPAEQWLRLDGSAPQEDREIARPAGKPTSPHRSSCR